MHHVSIISSEILNTHIHIRLLTISVFGSALVVHTTKQLCDESNYHKVTATQNSMGQQTKESIDAL